jgi:hypothetical protein
MSQKTVKLSSVLRAGVVIAAFAGALVASPAAASTGSKPMVDGHTYHAIANQPKPWRDSDGDGLSNWFETHRSHTNPFSADTNHNGISDAKENPDHDGLNNLQEEETGTNPLNSDSNGDGISDGNQDSDCDGVDNSQELADGTDPEDGDTNNDGTSDGQEDTDNDGDTNQDDQGNVEDPTCDNSQGDDSGN